MRPALVFRHLSAIKRQIAIFHHTWASARVLPMERSTTGSAYWLYLTTVGLTAGCGLVVEIVAGRMLAPYLGMSLYTWTAVIAVVLAGLSAGNWIGGQLADRASGRREARVAWVLALAALSTAGSLVLLRLVSGPILSLELAPVTAIVALTAALFFLPSLFVGIPSPILTKLAIEEDATKTGRIVGAMYAAGAFGSILGTLAAGFIFISWLGTARTMLMVAGIYAALALIFALRSARRDVPTILGLLAIMGLGAAGLGVGGQAVKAFRSNCVVESDYYCIRVVDISRDVGAETRVMVLDHLGHGINLRDAPQSFLSSYVELTDRLFTLRLGERRTFSAFFVGGGAYTLPRAWSAKYPEAKISVAEIDPAVTRVAAQEMWVDTTKLSQVLHADARHMLAKASTRFDIVVGDAFQDIAVPPHLVTHEFFALIAKRLKPEGVYVMTVVDHVTRPRLMLSLTETLRQSFATVEVWLDDEQAATGGRATFILLAAPSPTGTDNLRSPDTPSRIWRRWDEGRLATLTRRLSPVVLTDDFAPVDRLIATPTASSPEPSEAPSR